jgi:hypothetical protein
VPLRLHTPKQQHKLQLCPARVIPPQGGGNIRTTFAFHCISNANANAKEVAVAKPQAKVELQAKVNFVLIFTFAFVLIFVQIRIKTKWTFAWSSKAKEANVKIRIKTRTRTKLQLMLLFFLFWVCKRKGKRRGTRSKGSKCCSYFAPPPCGGITKAQLKIRTKVASIAKSKGGVLSDC